MYPCQCWRDMESNGVKSFRFSCPLWPCQLDCPKVTQLHSCRAKSRTLWPFLMNPVLWFFFEVTSRREQSSSKSCHWTSQRIYLAASTALERCIISFPLTVSWPHPLESLTVACQCQSCFLSCGSQTFLCIRIRGALQVRFPGPTVSGHFLGKE